MTEDDVNTELLQKIAKNVAELRSELHAFRDETRDEFETVRRDLFSDTAQVREETADAFVAVHDRIDTLANEAMLGFRALRDLLRDRARRRPRGLMRPKR